MKVRVLLNHQIQILFSNYFKKIKKSLSDPKSSKDIASQRLSKRKTKTDVGKNPIIYHQEDARREKLTTYIVTFPNPPLNKMR